MAFLGSLPFLNMKLARNEPRHLASAWTGPSTDPMPRLFAEFQSLLDRHATALAACDQIEAELQVRVGLPRVALPRGPDGGCRYVADVQSLARAMPPCRRRHRLEELLRHRQRRWDAAGEGSGLLKAELLGASFDEAVFAAADTLLAMPAWTYEAIALKLVILLSVRAPGPTLDDATPWRELRLILTDLGWLAGYAPLRS
ncbi:hypothetical protein [Methylobacterium sp. NFXW15]|uniref:hypothetical protein n=1 Tax=Methylobacterium sp. NFXW15 TaxID=2819512 RepID=UPI003CF38AB8